MLEIEIAALFIALIFFSAFSYWKKALDKKGVIVACIVGIAIFYFGSQQFKTGMIPVLFVLIFFVVAEMCTRYARMLKKKEHGVRSIGNILGNSGAALIALVFMSPVAFFAALNCALSDTVSSEIGMLSKSKPRLITSFRHVTAGTDGAVSALGTFASLAASLLFATLHFLIFFDAKAFAIIAFCGFFGMIADSFLGASLQREGILNNSTVNFFACAIAALASVFLYSL